MIYVGEIENNLCKYLEENNLIIKPGTPIDMKNWIRLTIGTHEQNEYFIKLLNNYLNK